jgi:hypothetical protein
LKRGFESFSPLQANRLALGDQIVQEAPKFVVGEGKTR